jgi:rhodanese-related sulfurtransferase
MKSPYFSSMSIPQVTPDQAKEILDKDPKALYLDVRSIPEFTQGHPAGAINIPLLHYLGGGMSPNADFVQVAQAVLPQDKKLIIGCKSGGRSQRACEVLSQLGYKDVSNVEGGFGGDGQQAGWKELGLPVSTDNGDGVSYESLVQKSK